jgi:SAM-dependent methyltransferase
MIDAIRAYWDRRPCNVRHSAAPAGSLEYSREVTARKRRVEPHLWQFARFPDWRGKAVLDLGCGIGTEALEFSRYGASVTALDLSARSLDVARVRAESEWLTITFHHADIEAHPFLSSESFDLVWAWGSLHHTPRPWWALVNAYDCLKPNGTLRLMLYHRYATKSLRLWLKAGCPRDFDAAVALGSEAQERCPLTRTYTRASARALVEGAGFQVTSMEVRHIFPWRVADYIEGRFVRGWPWRVLPERWVERWLGWHILIEAIVCK